MTSKFHRRIFLHFGGYHPIAPDESQRRFAHELARFARCWSINAQAGGVDDRQNATTDWQITAGGENWSSETTYRFFRWDDVIDIERSRGWMTRLPLGLASGLDFIFHGAAFGYIRHSWRYILFFLYPYLALGMIGIGTWSLARLAQGWAGTAPHILLTGLLSALLFTIALPLIGNRIYLDHLLDDWIHAMRLARAPDPAVDARINILAQELSRPDDAELLIFGHSLGAVHAVELIDRLISSQPDGPVIRFATAGSSILKIGLHRKSLWLREAVGRIARSKRVIWVDFQALNDVMNFYKSRPVAALGQDAPPVTTRLVRFRPGILPDRYRRMERNFFRLHNQFVHANDRRARYDFVMILAGPFPLEILAGSDEGAVPWISADGALTAEGQAALAKRGKT